MNKQDRARLLEMRANAKKTGVNRYRLAWYLMKCHPHLVVEIIREWLKVNEVGA